MKVIKKYKTVEAETATPFERFQMERHGNVITQYTPLVDDGDHDQVAQGNCIENIERPEVGLYIE